MCGMVQQLKYLGRFCFVYMNMIVNWFYSVHRRIGKLIYLQLVYIDSQFLTDVFLELQPEIATKRPAQL